MYLYFFDLDDTLCKSKEIINSIVANLDVNSLSEQELDEIIINNFINYRHENLERLNGPALNLLFTLINNKEHEFIYYITARDSRCRESSENWLKKQGLWLGEDKLLMDQAGKKGYTINNILKNNVNKKFAFLFDDMLKNHEDCLQYPNIIPCLPNLINV